MGSSVSLPSVDVRSRHSGEKRRSNLWVGINAFLSMRSPNTAATYAGIIKEWCLFLGAPAGSEEASQKVLEATDLHAIAYRNWLEKRPGQRPRMERKEAPSREIREEKRRRRRRLHEGLEATISNATIWKKFAALRRVYRMLIASEFGISGNPFDRDRVHPPPKDSGKKRPTEMVEFALVEPVLAQPDGTLPKGRRDRAMLATLFGGGLRRSEVVKLRVGDFRKSRGGTHFLYLRATKSRKDAEQAIPAWTAEAITHVIVDRRSQRASDGDYLFISFRGRGATVPTSHPVSDNGLYRLFKHYCRAAGAGNFVTPHSARATAITKLLSDGLSHREVQEFSRHSSIQMVEVYDKRRISVDESPGATLDFKIRRPETKG